MTCEPSGSHADRVVPRAERDRFVALAFCWADLLVEVGADRLIRFAAGPTEMLLGRAPASLAGMAFRDLFHDSVRLLADGLFDIAAGQGRFETTVVRLQGDIGPTPRLEMAGYRLGELNGHYYVAFRLIPTRADAAHGRDAETGLYDADAFAGVVASLLRERGGETGMTLLDIGGADGLRANLDLSGHLAFHTALGSSLRAGSLGGDAAARVAEDRYVVLHGPRVAGEDLRRQVAALIRSADPTGRGVPVAAETVALGYGRLRGDNVDNALIYMVNRFRGLNGAGLDLRDLPAGLPTLVGDAVASIRRFRGLLARGDFDVAFQPVVDVASGDIHHYEARCRFRRSLADESPYGYITFAEETGLIPEFDLAMAGKALGLLSSRLRDRRHTVAVNVSRRSVTSLSFATGIAALLDGNAWSRGRMIFEITDSTRIEDFDVAAPFIQDLRRRGYPVFLDDVGTGAAAFQQLSSLDVDAVKIDGAAVRAARRGAKEEAFFRALVRLCRDLEVKTIAEMIEEEGDLSFVRRCGVDLAQGHLLGRPSTDLGDFANRPGYLFTAREWL